MAWPRAGTAPCTWGAPSGSRAITTFSQFAVVYYPGIDHMHAMIGSRFMNRVGPGKQLGDTLAVASIPVLSQL